MLKARPGTRGRAAGVGRGVAARGDAGVARIAAKVEWLFTRKGALVAGVGDEETLLPPTDAPDVQAKVRLTKDEAIAKLKDWLAGVGLRRGWHGARLPPLQERR